MEKPESIRLERYIKPGELVKVMDGPFRDLVGSVKDIQGETRLIVSIEGVMQTVSLNIDMRNVQKL